MNNENTHRILSLSQSYQEWIIEDKKKKFLKSNSLLDKFSVIYEDELCKLPYRLNLLDDLSTNENAHSKFLIRLLQHQPTLKNFLAFINNSSKTPFSFDINSINKPILTAEKMRIDGLIKENNRYAIIIENKIHGAAEQDRQIARYIDKCKMIGFKVEQIYILYLTRNEEDNPSLQTWGDDYKQEDFHSRYSKLSYKSEILTWLASYLTTLSPKEELIKSAITQYIDHLKHIFNNKEFFFNMNTELQKFLSTELNLSTDKAENIDVISKKINEINELKEQLKELATTSKNDLFKEWRNNIDELFDFEENQKFIKSNPSFLRIGVILNYKGKRFSVLIEYNFNTIYFGFGKHSANDILEPEIKEFLEPLLKSETLKEDEPWWYGWKYTSFNNGYMEFENLLKEILTRINSTK